MVRQLIVTILFLALPCIAEDYIIATGENGTEEVYVADRMVYTNWVNDAVLWMPFPAEKTAGTYFDYSIAQNDGTQGTAGFRPAFTNAFGGAYEFDGGDDRIEIADAAALDLQSPFTINAWFNRDDVTGNDAIVGKFWDGSTRGWYLRTGGIGTNLTTTFTFRPNGEGADINVWSDINATLDAATWYMSSVVYDSTNYTVYVNTVSVAGPTAAAQVDSNNSDVYIGEGGHTTVNPFLPFDGLIDDVRIYDRALTTNEVSALYLAEPTIANGGKR